MNIIDYVVINVFSQRREVWANPVIYNLIHLGPHLAYSACQSAMQGFAKTVVQLHL